MTQIAPGTILASRAIRETVDRIYRTESRRVLATLIRLIGGDFELAEDVMHEAFAAALEKWPKEGLPSNPRAWLITTGKFKAIDQIRRRARFERSLPIIAEEIDSQQPQDFLDERAVEDDQLRLIFTCCHPALPPEAQIALTLREVCGLTTEEIARAFLVPPATLAQRIVRAKSKIRTAAIPYKIPEKEDLPDRLAGVLHAIYLVFNEGYSASSGASLIRADLSGEAIRLGRLLLGLLPEPEAAGLLALMLLQESRRTARVSAEGDLILLADQDRSLWNRAQIAEGLDLTRRAISSGIPGPYALQAAIASMHAVALESSQTDWSRIVMLYDQLLTLSRSPVIELNRAVAVAMDRGPAAGIELIDEILARGDLEDYHLAHSARADLCRRIGRTSDARSSYVRALELTQQEPERRLLERRLSELSSA